MNYHIMDIIHFYGVLKKNNTEMTKLLIEYANKNNIILELNEKDKDVIYPLIWSIDINNIEITKLLIEYANKNNILLKFYEKDKIYEYDIIQLLCIGKIKGVIDIKYSFFSHLKTQIKGVEKEFVVAKVRKEKERKEKEEIERIEKEQIQPSNSTDNPFKLINEIKNGDTTLAINTINMHENLIDISDYRGWTALHWACYFGYDEIVKLLLKKNAEINIKTEQGIGNDSLKSKTAKEIAEIRNNEKCKKMINGFKRKKTLKKVKQYFRIYRSDTSIEH